MLVMDAITEILKREGIKTLHDMFDFNDMGALVVLAPLAFVDRKRIVEKAVMAIISLAFMAFYVKVGVDEMQWHRLYLPALPFLCVLAALGAQNAIDAAVRAFGKKSGGSEPGSLHTLLSVPWTCQEVGAFDPLWQDVANSLRNRGFSLGRGSYSGWDDGDAGLGRAAWCVVRHTRPNVVVA